MRTQLGLFVRETFAPAEYTRFRNFRFLGFIGTFRRLFNICELELDGYFCLNSLPRKLQLIGKGRGVRQSINLYVISTFLCLLQHMRIHQSVLDFVATRLRHTLEMWDAEVSSVCMSAEMREERDPGTDAEIAPNGESTAVAAWLPSGSNDTSVTSPPEFAFDFVLSSSESVTSPTTVASPSSLIDDRGYGRKTPGMSNLCCFIAAVNSTGKPPTSVANTAS